MSNITPRQFATGSSRSFEHDQLGFASSPKRNEKHSLGFLLLSGARAGIRFGPLHRSCGAMQ